MSKQSAPCWVVALSIMASGSVALAGDGVVALQTADPACPNDSSNRYVSCLNGTVTDNETGLVWLANADCFGEMDWYNAMASVAGLSDVEDEVCDDEELSDDECDCNLSDGSSAGEWRLPSIDEWKALTADAFAMGCDPALTDNSGQYCWSEDCNLLPGRSCSFYRVQYWIYWSSLTYLPDPSQAWLLGLWNPFGQGQPLGVDPKINTRIFVWPVRGGQ